MSQSGATIPGQSRPGSITQSSSIIRASPSDCLVSYVGHSLGGSYSSSEIQLVYSTTPADCAIYDFK